MALPHQTLVDAFFAAYMKRDFNGIRQVMAPDITWYFLGNHPMAGVKRGLEEVIAFFDSMGQIMGKSKPSIEKPIVAENGKYLVECVHTRTNREDGNDIDHFACVLWTFDQGKIVQGRHFFADPPAVDRYFTAVAPSQ